MKKRFKCSSCFRNCETTFALLDGGKGTNPTRCIVDPDVMCAWNPIDEPKPPKLTQDIFETDECPSWAEYAAVDAYGDAYFFSSKPTSDLYNGGWLLTGCAYSKTYRGGTFDDTNWATSLIKRESKIPEPPAWVYNAEYGYHQEYGYVRLDEIMERETQVTIVDTGETRYVYNAIFSNGRIVEARKRSFNEKEMQSLIGKVFESPYRNFLVTGYNKQTNYIKVNEMWFNAEDLMNGKDSYTPLIDGKPCYVLEHLNKKGEWVK